jgi:two-component system vancomycin resistance associated response regulator VraR
VKVRVLLYDAYVIALEGIHDTLKKMHDFDIVGAFSEDEDVFDCLKSSPVDVIVANLMLKSNSGLDFISKIRDTRKDVKIIILTECQDEIVYKRAMELNVNAFLRKDATYSELIGAIANVAKGNNIIPEFVMKDTDKSLLTDMELKILELIADEQTTEEIAKELYISRRTVESHVVNICGKLGVDTRIGAVRKATNLNIL